MDPGRGWPPPPGGNAHGNPDQSQPQPQPQPPRNAFGPGRQSPPQGHSGLPPPPPSGPFPHFHQPPPPPPSLASLAGFSQSSPRQPTRPDGPPQSLPQQLALPGFSQATGQPGAAERERERERERAREAETHIKEEEDRRHRELQDRQRFEQAPPHQTQAGPPMHLHQPVAVGPRSAVHGPNGLLANPGPQPPPSFPLGAPTGPANIFAGGPVQPTAQNQAPTVQQMQAGMLMPLPPGAQQQGAQAQAAQQGQGQGQQPILNDALSYLDQVKVQFAEHPDVYNRFLDIMKDFKSGAIDTPGVIGRVSTLFAGNPDLIQGFNTFLPPGYRIECGPGNDPNAIRVTTPMGSSIHPMPQPQPPRSYPEDGGQDSLRPPNGTSTPQPGQLGVVRALSPGGRPLPISQQPHLAAIEAARQQEQQVMHQQEQRGVSSLQNAVSAATGGGTLRAGVSPRTTPLPGQQDANATADGQPGATGMEKRGPVEFNHAISYVNKIKNRFASHPDIYKQFLEILQTYQRESKPIQDVYSQVTRLFDGAPDLLEDFKQFLPESAAQAKAAENAKRAAEENILTSNIRGEAYNSPIMSRETQMGTPSHGRSNLPPVGNFAPTPVTKDNNRKRKDRGGTAGSTMDNAAMATGGKAGGYGVQPNKRVKQTHQQAGKGPDMPPTSPTLIPRLPEPIPPTTTSAATHDELAFFDRAKKAIGNKNTMNEFLKVCNLFSQDFIDRTSLVHRAKAYFGQNPELMKWFADFVGYDERDIVVENKARVPAIPGGRISLSNCRGLGPSYRLLPKRERVKVCSGRDELCNSVLNDEWASHPTWASEDSGFIAHRKNAHEEGLHRIEEERHDYDYNIEACSRTIQLLEPIAQQLRRMSNEEQKQYVLPPGLGGQSETIYKRVIMKLYGRDRGAEVVQLLHNAPYSIIPVLLNRLKERLETWKFAQREWEKVWREQTQKMFWKSLDHQSAGSRVNDRRHFQSKALLSEMQVRYEEMRNEEEKTRTGFTRGKPQYAFVVSDVDAVADALWLVGIYLRVQDSPETPKLEPFLREFLAMFLGMDYDVLTRKVAERSGGTPINGESSVVDGYASGTEENGERRNRKSGKTTLLRQAVDKGSKGKFGRKDREDSSTSMSRASTPDAASRAGDDAATDGMAVDSTATADNSAEAKVAATAAVPQRWFDHPTTEDPTSAKTVDPNEPQPRHVYRMWASPSIFCFMRVLMQLYERLQRLKMAEAECRETVKNAKKHKPAMELGINDKLPHEFFADTSPTANYYQQMLDKFVHVLEGDLDFVNDGVDECLRRFYLQNGYPLYAFEKIVQAIVRFGAALVNQEGGNKERSWDLLQLWKKDRVKSETSAVQSTDYRKAAEKLIGNNVEKFRIEWDDQTKIASFYAVKDDWFYIDDFPTAYDLENRWRYYIASYTSLDSTEGVNQKFLSPVILARNVHALGVDPKSNTFPPFNFPSELEGQDPIALAQSNAATGEAQTAVGERLFKRFMSVRNDEKLVFRIAIGNYHRVFQPGTAEGFYHDIDERTGGEEGVKMAEEAGKWREEVAVEGMVQGSTVVGGGEGDGGFEELVVGEEVGGEGEGMEVDG